MQWLLTSCGRRRGTIKSGVLHPIHRVVVKGDSYWVIKHSYNIRFNYYESTKAMAHISKGAQTGRCSIKILVDGVFLYGHISEQLLECFRTVLGILKHHSDTLKMKD